jgi:hypothetical protein
MGFCHYEADEQQRGSNGVVEEWGNEIVGRFWETPLERNRRPAGRPTDSACDRDAILTFPPSLVGRRSAEPRLFNASRRLEGVSPYRTRRNRLRFMFA